MRYYQAEHEAAYRRIRQAGHTQWNDLFEASGGFEQFPNRPFLERILPELELPAAAEVLEYGCGTGPAACFLAARGFRVHAIDLIPDAIMIARRLAAERGLEVDFEVQDVCALAAESSARRYDLVLDSFCLQSIVLDEDRRAVFAAVRDRLKPTGYYVISTATHDPDRGYDPGTYDVATGINYQELPEGDATVDGATMINGRWHQPHRRHLTAPALRAELISAGFRVLRQEGQQGGDLICVPAGPFPEPAEACPELVEGGKPESPSGSEADQPRIRGAD
ncbi:class I SAM-dependent methyltransferase [Microlunatus speluncae]|uniref:class I SAM-dependent methyltransferase n=1 Tax=Microlunatus speluncae TaxID=2594267 RepID=UPI0012665632|nr:class I SAM-dependent methyltransferase [Microlunatus speluncae]